MSVSAFALTFWKIGHLNSLISVASMAAAIFSLAGSITGEWKAPPTGSKRALLAPASFKASHAASTAGISPEITSCPGQL